MSKVTLTSTGQQVATASIKVIRIRDGKIALFRDYVNSQGLEELLRD
jgi:ketosteroid isomerase-like protein